VKERGREKMVKERGREKMVKGKGEGGVRENGEGEREGSVRERESYDGDI